MSYVSALQGIMGADVKTIEFETVSKEILVLKTDICMSRQADLFYQVH